MPGVGFDLLSIQGIRKGPSRDYLWILMKIICCLEMRMLIKRHPLLFIAGWVSGSSKERSEWGSSCQNLPAGKVDGAGVGCRAGAFLLFSALREQL